MELGWIDFSKSERSKILSVLDLLSESATLDELGIAPIRDGFSNLFFPGTSTIQTRAKYFFVVPYVLEELELSKESNLNRILASLDAIEKQCGQEFLRQNSEENGIIGKRSLQNHSWVKRTPADIYWSGLKRYGIFVGGNLSLSEYTRASCALKQQKATLNKLGNRKDDADEYECDDKNAGDLFRMKFWHMPLYSKDWQEKLTIKLTPAEGKYLKEQIILSCKDSLLAYVLDNHLDEFIDCESFQKLGKLVDTMPSQLKNDYQLALEFSDFIYAVRTIYNIIISDGKNDDANSELDKLASHISVIAGLDIDIILDRLEIRSNPLLKRFLLQAQRAMQENDIEALKKCITSREIQLKGSNRAKTIHPGEFDENEWIGGGELDYRFYNARTIIRDIFESEVEVRA